MCGRFSYLTFQEMEDVVGALERQRKERVRAAGRPGDVVRLSAVTNRDQARPRSAVQAVVSRGQRFELADFSWGFRPTASTDVVFNTRLESALSGVPLWRRPLREGRCILPVASFFEPHRSEKAVSPKTGRPVKLQYEFRDVDGAPLLLASIHDGTSLSVLTTEPNTQVRPVHPRMPLVLALDEVPRWLEGDLAKLSALADRSQVRLAVTPERPTPESPPEQLSLF